MRSIRGFSARKRELYERAQNLAQGGSRYSCCRDPGAPEEGRPDLRFYGRRSSRSPGYSEPALPTDSGRADHRDGLLIPGNTGVTTTSGDATSAGKHVHEGYQVGYFTPPKVGNFTPPLTLTAARLRSSTNCYRPSGTYAHPVRCSSSSSL